MPPELIPQPAYLPVYECYTGIIGVFEVMENVCIENEKGKHLKASLEGMREGCIVEEPQVAAVPMNGNGCHGYNFVKKTNESIDG